MAHLEKSNMPSRRKGHSDAMFREFRAPYIRQHRRISSFEHSIRRFFRELDKCAKIPASSTRGSHRGIASSEDAIRRFFIKMDFYVQTTIFIMKQHDMIYKYHLILRSPSYKVSVPLGWKISMPWLWVSPDKTLVHPDTWVWGNHHTSSLSRPSGHPFVEFISFTATLQSRSKPG